MNPGEASNQEAQRRKRAVSFELGLQEGDTVFSTISRADGLFVITEQAILRIRSDKDIDPEANYGDAPWEKTIYIPHGSRDPVVARTVIQTEQLANTLLFGASRRDRASLNDLSWEVMRSLVSLRHIRDRLDKEVDRCIGLVEADLDGFTKGTSPKPLPFVPYFDIEFRSYVNEVRRLLTKIGEVFLPIAGFEIDNGHFHKALPLVAGSYGADSLPAQMLTNDLRWIEAWIRIRVAIEHPRPDMFVETMNFSLEADRRIRLPTWRFVHSDYPDMARPQNLLLSLEFVEANLLKFYEDIQVALSRPASLGGMMAAWDFVEEEARDPRAPVRYRFGFVPNNSQPTGTS